MTQPLPIDGVDISHHQGGRLDFARAQRAGVRWIYHKATEGSTWRDGNYHQRRREAADAGIPFGGYHFASPDGDDAVAEARAFMAYADPRPGDLVPVLDFEVSHRDPGRWCRAFMAELERLMAAKGLGGKPMHYGPNDFDRYPYLRWVPRYNDDNRPPPQHWDVWQFSNGVYGVPDSCPGLGHVDLNTMRAGLRVADFTIPGNREEPDVDPFERPLWRGRTNVDRLTIAAMEYAESLCGRTFVVTQGSYQGGSGDPNSAGTHDGGGALDLRWSTVDAAGILALRKAGFAAWHRTPAQGPWPHHVHAVLVGHQLLSRSAADQVVAYRNGRNGLANNGRDDGPRLDPIPVFDWKEYVMSKYGPENWDAADVERFQRLVATTELRAPWSKKGDDTEITLERAVRALWQQPHRALRVARSIKALLRGEDDTRA